MFNGIRLFFYNLFGRNPVDPIKQKPMPDTPLITRNQLHEIAPTIAPPFRLPILCDLFNELCPKYGITDKGVFQMFLANVVQESGEFAHKEENMNYKAATLIKVWPSRFSPSNASNYAHNPEKLANLVYGGRMGNYLPGDGFQFKGAGFIGITGRELYTKYAKYIGKDLTLTASLMKSDDRYALDSACWFFAVLKDLVKVAKTGDFKAVCKGINGGMIRYDVRVKYWERAKKVIV